MCHLCAKVKMAHTICAIYAPYLKWRIKASSWRLALGLAEKLTKRESYTCMQLDTAQPADHLVRFYQKSLIEISIK